MDAKKQSSLQKFRIYGYVGHKEQERKIIMYIDRGKSCDTS